MPTTTYNYTGTSGNDIIGPPLDSLNYYINGGAGSDTVFIPTSSLTFTISEMDSNGVITISGASNKKLYLTAVEVVTFMDRSVTLSAAPTTTAVTGTSGADRLTGTSGNNTIDGAAGIDSLAMTSVASTSATLSKSGSTWTLSSTATGTDTITNVERLLFSDKSIALDLAVGNAAANTALLLGAVLPGQLVFDASKQTLLGTVIGFFDGGYTMAQLSGAVLRLPIWSELTGGFTDNTHIAQYLLTNVNGVAPDSTTLATAVNALNTESFQGTWLAELALSSANQTHIGLTGLAQHGLTYL